jgi:hypothetical protein
MKLLSCSDSYFLHNKKTDSSFMLLRYATKMVIRLASLILVLLIWIEEVLEQLLIMAIIVKTKIFCQNRFKFVENLVFEKVI